VAIDDSKRTRVMGILRPGADEPETRSLPNAPRHVRRVFARLTHEGPVRVCYEAGPSGYDRSRQLTALDVPCQVMAPALTPRKPGDRIKTDRRDAAKLVRLFRAGELTPITVPDEAGEAGRDLLRCREDVQEDLLRGRHRLGKFLARHGRGYREGRNWTQRHWTWIRRQRFDLPALERTLAEYRCAVEQLLARVADLNREIAALAETAPYREQVGWLRCFRGIDTLAAMTLLAEIGDFQRFDHPRQLMAYLGLVPSENSSGTARSGGASPRPATSTPGASWSKPAGMPATHRGSARPWPAGVRGSRRAFSRTPGRHSSDSTGGIGISSAMGSAPPSPWWRAPASWSASSGLR
jgi:transposase